MATEDSPQTEKFEGADEAGRDRKATIIDIAQMTGYSIATVSRALNNFSNVKDATKKRILEIAKSLNYVPNVAAKNLVKGRSKLVGLVLPDRSGIYNDLVNYLYRDLLKMGYHMVVYNSNNESSKQVFYVEQLMMQQVDGLIIIPIPGDYRILDRVLHTKVPSVVFNRFVRDYPVEHVLFDLRKGVTEAVDYLASRGREHFWQFARQDVYLGHERRRTFQFALKVNGLAGGDDRTLPVDDSFESGYEQMKLLLGRGDAVDAVLCASDFAALGVIRALLDAGVQVPEQIAVVGCYDSALASYSNPRISTIQCDFRAASRMIADKVALAIKGGAGTGAAAVVDSSFVHRETT